MSPEQLAAKRFNDHKLYAAKLIRKFPATLVEPGDLYGFWYESLYETAVKFPEKALEERLHLVMAYRYMGDLFKARNRKKRLSVSEWSQRKDMQQIFNSYIEYYNDLLKENYLDDINNELDKW